MSGLEGFEDALIEYIRTEVNPKVSRLDRQTDLFAREVVDSLGVLALVGFVENRFGFEVEPDDISLESFRTVAAIHDFVVQKLGD
jgi:acyl carrier protein